MDSNEQFMIPTMYTPPHTPPISVTQPNIGSPLWSIPCYLCNKSLSDFEALKEHVRLHTENTRKDSGLFTCKICHIDLRSLQLLEAHYDLYHKQRQKLSIDKQESNFKCRHCKISFKNQSFLRNHMKTSHSGTKLVELTANHDKPINVWRTFLWNAFAATNYDPTTESASKYIPPEKSSQDDINQWGWVTVPIRKRKYVPRSPFSNPNLWFCNDAVV